MLGRVCSYIALGLAVTACASERREPEWAGSIDTLNGGVVRVQNPAAGVWDSASTWTITKDLELGSAGGEGPDAFGYIRDLDVDEAGRIYVLDGDASAVRIFDSEGQFVRSVGRPGDGPGEFRLPAGVAVVPGGAFWVADPWVGRYTLFDSTGTVQRVVRQGILSTWDLLFPWQGGVDSAGRVYDYNSTATGPILVRFGSQEGQVPPDSFEVPIHMVDTWLLLDAGGTLRASMPVPFATRILRFIASNGHLWLGDNVRYAIAEQELEGDTIRLISRAFEHAPVTDADAHEARQPTQGIIRNGGRVDGPPLPDYKPAFRWFLVDDEGYLWVDPYLPSSADGRRLDIFDPEGRFLGTVEPDFTFDPSIMPVVRAGSIYTIAHDELDVQYVIRGRIARR